MDREQFLDEVRRRSGLDTAEQAARATETVLSVLGSLLPDLAVRAVSDDLPDGLGRALRSAGKDDDLDAPGLYRRVAHLEGVAEGFAAEHTQVVCQVLAETAGYEALAHLEKHLAPSVAALCRPREPLPAAPPHPHPHGRRGHKLSDGRPGSEHPLNEADRPPAHSGSVLRSQNPHANTKLSSTRGISTEREGEPLSRGRPGSRRPLSESGND